MASDRELVMKNAYIVSLLPIDESIDAIRRGEWGPEEGVVAQQLAILQSMLDIKRRVEALQERGLRL